MNKSFAPEDKLVQYLLGRMPEQERAELEERLFTDEELDEQLLATTDDLIQAYLAGTLPEEDRSRFESHFLSSPENREHLALMRDLLPVVERAAVPERAPRARPRTLAAAAVVVLAVVVALVLAARRRSPGTGQVTSGPRPTPSAIVSTETARPSPTVPEPPRVSVVRLAGNTGTLTRVRLSPSARAVRVEVAVDHKSPSYDATLLAADGKAIWRAEGRAAARAEPLVLEVPAEIFASGRYTLRVEGESLRESVPLVLEYRLQVVRATASPR
jgi:Putative zinc-finger